jgi:transcriptional regulator with XRE-family HTH domain
MLLKRYREQAELSQSELATGAGLSASTISRVESGERGPLGKRKQVLALARALELSQADTDMLLSAADLAPSAAPELALHPRDETLYRIAQELEALRTSPEITPSQVRFVEETLLLVLRGARTALPETELDVVSGGVPSTPGLSEEERYLDDLLGDCISGRLAGEQTPFTVFAAVARSPRWELKRRLAEALPALLSVDAEWTIPLMRTLRDDPPDPEWRTDIRRRVIEAAPSLWEVKPEQVESLLRWREGDEVYAVLASLDSVAEIESRGADAQLLERIRTDLLAHVRAEWSEAATVYAQILKQAEHTPDAALGAIRERLHSQDRLMRICLARSLHHLLDVRPADTLKLMEYLLRQEEGHSAEHQNVRRAVARHPEKLIAWLDPRGPLWGAHHADALGVLRTMASDRDVHIRRALSDILPNVVLHAPKVALELIEYYLLQDRDRFVQERTWTALRELMRDGSERAEELCARLIELA